MTGRIDLDREALSEFCRRWRIRELSLFGSALRDDYRPDSDLDLLVSFEPDVTLDIDALLAMREELETRYGRPVDLVEKETLRNPWRKLEILRTREVIYAA
jgi:predicted nucleotidyltransferase